jgi:hypothetical protein
LDFNFRIGFDIIVPSGVDIGAAERGNQKNILPVLGVDERDG